MIIATLIIVSFIFLAVCIGLFLNYKANLKTFSTIVNFQDAITQNLSGFKKEIFEKNQLLNTETNSKLDASKNEILTSIKNGIEKILYDANDNSKTIDNKITSAKTEILTSIEPKLTNIREEVQTTRNNLQKEIENTLTKVDVQLKNHEQKQHDIIIEVKNKFDKIIEEIKSPLTLD